MKRKYKAKRPKSVIVTNAFYGEDIDGFPFRFRKGWRVKVVSWFNNCEGAQYELKIMSGKHKGLTMYGKIKIVNDNTEEVNDGKNGRDDT